MVNSKLVRKYVILTLGCSWAKSLGVLCSFCTGWPRVIQPGTHEWKHSFPSFWVNGQMSKYYWTLWSSWNKWLSWWRLWEGILNDLWMTIKWSPKGRWYTPMCVTLLCYCISMSEIWIPAGYVVGYFDIEYDDGISGQWSPWWPCQKGHRWCG